ncbi:hypothetical protein MINT15_04770 [Saccharomonospora viridis]|uniref:Uncharacterized protein n=1 Tax=Saccharomonospora viridis TaxID=1852 RepID=A0A837DJT5_9PSEU|nr:hypothetical protein MINT15_04770 [Saccharomonospora viridis]
MWPDDTTWSFTGGFSQEAEGFTARAQHEATGTRRPRRWARRAQRIPPESTPPQSSRHHKQDPQRTRSGSRSDVVTRNHGRALEVKTVGRIFSPIPQALPHGYEPRLCTLADRPLPRKLFRPSDWDRTHLDTHRDKTHRSSGFHRAEGDRTPKMRSMSRFSLRSR